MLVKDLIEQLSKMDPETEVFLYKQGGMGCPGYSTTRIKVVQGYVVRDPENSGRLHTRAKGNGLFVDTAWANQVMGDGKKFLDLTSPTIHPAIQIDLPRY